MQKKEILKVTHRSFFCLLFSGNRVVAGEDLPLLTAAWRCGRSRVLPISSSSRARHPGWVAFPPRSRVPRSSATDNPIPDLSIRNNRPPAIRDPNTFICSNQGEFVSICCELFPSSFRMLLFLDIPVPDPRSLTMVASLSLCLLNSSSSSSNRGTTRCPGVTPRRQRTRRCSTRPRHREDGN